MSDAKSYPAWISVEDQLPENSDFVLAVVNGNYKVPGMNVTFTNGMVIASWWGEADGWHLAGYPEHDPEKLKVTHWMPLPEPPKEAARVATKEELFAAVRLIHKHCVSIEFGCCECPLNDWCEEEYVNRGGPSPDQWPDPEGGGEDG